MPLEHKTHTVAAAEAGRVDLIVKAMTGRTRSQLRGMCMNGCLSINGQAVFEPSTTVKEGDVIDVRYDTQCKYREQWLGKFQSKSPKGGPFVCKSFSVVYEDDYLIVVDKQAGILTVPTERHESRTLVDEVSRYLGGRSRALVVHRLDRETSGLVVFAKQSNIAGALQNQLRLRAPDRVYLTIVAGVMKEDSGKFESYLATSKRLSRYSVENPRGGEHAVTHFEVAERLLETTFVRAKLDTGRRNQIRVHLAEAGHPIIGDRRYRPDEAQHFDWPHSRLALHAHVLGFQHPVTGEDLRFVSEMPRTFQTFLRQQRRTARELAEDAAKQPQKSVAAPTKRAKKNS